MADSFFAAVKKGVDLAAQTVVSTAFRSDKDFLYKTVPDFEHADGYRKRLVVIGDTGSGKSVLLNVMAGWTYICKETAPGSFQYTNELYKEEGENKKKPLFEPAPIDKVTSTTQDTAYALVDYLNDPARPIMLIDTPGHDDSGELGATEAEIADRVRLQDKDLTDKMKCLGYVNAIIVVFDLSKNKLSGSMKKMLESLEIKFKAEGHNVWNHVMIGYTKCNATDKTWRGDFETKGKTLQKAIKQEISSCDVEVPFFALGGLQDPDAKEVGVNDGFERIWDFIKERPQLPTRNLKEYEAVGVRIQRLIKERNEANHRARMGEVYMGVVLQLFAVLFFLMFRAVLPGWLSILLFNFNTMLDEAVILGGFVWIVGVQDIKGSLDIFYDRWIKNYLLPKLSGLAQPESQSEQKKKDD
jgi:GTPase SAR1 family protein